MILMYLITSCDRYNNYAPLLTSLNVATDNSFHAQLQDAFLLKCSNNLQYYFVHILIVKILQYILNIYTFLFTKFCKVSQNTSEKTPYKVGSTVDDTGSMN